MALAPYIDHTLLKQTTTREEIAQICSEAVLYGFAAVCIPPVFVAYAAQQLKQSPVRVATVIGFPFGYTFIATKCNEAEQAIQQGAQELDMVMNISALKNKNTAYLEEEIQSLLAITQKNNTTVKVIIESGILSVEEIITCCNIYKHFPVEFLKTSTGYAGNGATLEAVQLMRQHLPSSIQIKASGGIRTRAFADQLIEAGATRLGCSASVAIINDAAGNNNSY